MKIGIIKEFKNPPDKRVVFTPKKCIEAKERFPELDFLIQKSEIRSFTDKEYEDVGLTVVDDVSLADIIIYKKMDYPIELKEIFKEIFEFYSEI